MSREQQTVRSAQSAWAAPSRVLQRACACGQHSGNGGECEACRQKRLGLQRQAISQTTPNTAPPIVHDVLRSSGQPLDAATRSFMEPRFGQDFSGVRVHTDGKAAESARVVNALAYTVRRDIVFGAGQYTPGTSIGRRLLAHELTHAAQQGNGVIQDKLEIGQPAGSHEQEADRAADRIVLGRPAFLNDQGSRPTLPSGMLFTYRNKEAFNFRRKDEPGLKEEQFTNSKTQPWIE